MSKIEVEYRDVSDASFVKMLKSREEIVIEGSHLRPSTSWLRWAQRTDAGGQVLILTEYSNPTAELARFRPEQFTKLSDQDLKLRIAGLN